MGEVNSTPLQLNAIVNVQAYKLSGDLYRQYNGLKIIQISDVWCTLLAWKTKVAKKNLQKWIIKEPTFWFFPLASNSFYNVLATYRNNEFSYYVNIASPFIFEENIVKYVDYDLDIKFDGGNHIKILDEGEFFKNAEMYQYKPEIKKYLYDSLSDVTTQILNREGIFNKMAMHDYYKKNRDLFHTKK